MARQPGLYNFVGTIEVLAGGPLDARTVVPNITDLTANGTFDFPYVGMIVSVESEGKAYILKNINYTNIDNWQELGTGSISPDGGVIWGYYNSYDDTFYEYKMVSVTTGITYKNPIIPDIKYLYVDKDTFKSYIYRFDGAYGTFHDISSPYRFENMPPLHNEDLYQEHIGRVVQYVGTEDTWHPYKTGHFYQCIEDPSNPSVYIWHELEIQPHGVRQYITMPTTFGGLDGAQVGDIVQYIGATDSNYTKGCFYECVEDFPGAYSWKSISVTAEGAFETDPINWNNY